MGWSKRKPYYGLGGSIVQFFREPVRYLKESNVKESQFEKPYLSPEYPNMHLRFPFPNWPAYPGVPAVTGFGAIGSKIHTIIFSDPSCHPGVANLGCGDSDKLRFSIWSTPPAGLGAAWTWEVVKTAANPESLLDQIEMSEPKVSGTRGDVVSVVLAADEDVEEDGTITICAKAVWEGAAGLKAVTVDVPEGVNPFLAGAEALGRPGQPPTRLSRELERSTAVALICCQDVAVEACCVGEVTSWNGPASATEIAAWDGVNEESKPSVAVYVNGSGDNIDWTISGTGFWLNKAHTLTSVEDAGIGVLVYADESCCGTAHVIAQDCKGDTAGGYVLCTTGEWELDAECSQGGGSSVPGSTFYSGAYKYQWWGECCNPATCGTDNHCCSFVGIYWCTGCDAEPPDNSTTKLTVERSVWVCIP